jgi:hypothetical protein
MDSRILKELHESALGMYEAGTMSEQVYLKFKNLYEADLAETSGNKDPKKSK